MPTTTRFPSDNGSGNLFTFALTSLVMGGTGTVSLNNSQNLGNDTITVNSGTLAATSMEPWAPARPILYRSTSIAAARWHFPMAL